MRVNVAEPTTSNAPTALHTARWKLRSCRNTGRHRETRARKRVSNTAGGSWLYFYQGSTQVHQSPTENVQTPEIRSKTERIPRSQRRTCMGPRNLEYLRSPCLFCR